MPFRFFILNLTADPAQPDQEQVFINPEIVKRHSSEEDEEGCLSFPGLYSKVRRARKIRVKAYDLQGNEVDSRPRTSSAGRSSTRPTTSTANSSSITSASSPAAAPLRSSRTSRRLTAKPKRPAISSATTPRGSCWRS